MCTDRQLKYRTLCINIIIDNLLITQTLIKNKMLRNFLIQFIRSALLLVSGDVQVHN